MLKNGRLICNGLIPQRIKLYSHRGVKRTPRLNLSTHQIYQGGSVQSPQYTTMSNTDMSKTIVLTGYGGYDKLKIEARPRPQPAEGQVLLRVRASGINFAELMYRMGLYSNAKSKPPVVLGMEGAGDVCELGEGVSTLKVGDRVMCLSGLGLWSEYAAVNADRCFKISDAMTYEEAAAIPVNYITAYHMLFEMGNLREGKSVLVHMVAGGVGVAATQLIKSVPNTTIFGTCSAPKHATVKKFGVDHPIDYRTEDYVTEVRKVSPKGVDIVLDPLSGDDSVKGYKLLKPLGNIIHFGAANVVSGENRSLWQIFKTYWGTKTYNPLFMISDNKGIHGYHLGFLEKHPEVIQSAAVELLQMYTDGHIKPQIDSVWAFEDVAQAMARMHERKNIGKVVLSPQQTAGETDIRNTVIPQ